MPADSDKYREHLYRYREHPNGSDVPEGFSDQRDSFFTVYLSVLPFLVVEYYAELSFHVLPSGLIFPVGFLLFWAFFYTYYKPGFLEKRLSNTDEWDFAGIPAILLGVLVWFVKVTVVSAARVVLSYVGIRPPPEANAQRPSGQPGAERRAQQERAFRDAQAQEQARTRSRAQASPPPRPKAPGLPSDIQQALSTLGLSECRDWQIIHRRYRELAKQYHPDLNPNLTDVGRRFMMYDAAYRKLSQVKSKYFAA